MTTDEWVTAALADDVAVVELLFRLKQSAAAAPQQPAKTLQVAQPTLAWGSRQPRTKLAAAVKKERESMRCSPTTPLSWTCGSGAHSSSPSDGCDDSNRSSDLSSGARSKGAFNSVACTSIEMQSIRKKSFSELQEEESLLPKERTHLKKELATVHVVLKEQEARSHNLKRLKVDLHQPPMIKMGPNSDGNPEASSSYQPRAAEPSGVNNNVTALAPDSSKVEKGFVLPDLNMVPPEDESGFVS